MVIDPVLEKLIESPRLNLFYAQLHQVVEEEQARREQFYATVREGEKAEFINGEVIVQSPVKLRHSLASKHLLVLLDAYVRKHELGLVAHEKLLIALTRNDYEPDVCFFSAAKASVFLPDQMKFPAPDFVAEVLSPSTAGTDRGVKFEDYAAHGVEEYWVVDPEAEQLEQYLLEGDRYRLAFMADNGTVASHAVAGFSVPVRALFDEAENLAALRRMLGT